MATSLYGKQIASVRRDELDQAALEHVCTLAQTGAVSVLDLGCGVGAMSAAFALEGAHVVALDRQDFGVDLASRRQAAGLRVSQLVFLRGTAPACVLDLAAADTWHVVYSQRMLHYMTYSEARETLERARAQTRRNGKLYLCVSGLASGLSDGYGASQTAVHKRYGYLAPKQQAEHEIYEPVCLYTAEELSHLVRMSGYLVQRVWQSHFGNVKLEATTER